MTSPQPGQLMLAQPPLSRATGWYYEPNSSGQDVLTTAFEESKSHLKKQLPEREYNTIIALCDVNNHNHNAQKSSPSQPQSQQPAQHHKSQGIESFAETLRQVRKGYEDRTATPTGNGNSKPSTKAKMWLTNLSARVNYYGNILDVLVQHHPEYVSLAWGTFKFLFVAIQNHAELVAKVSKCASHIADLLPQQNMLLILYPTTAMREAMAHLYACVMKFLRQAIGFYCEGRFKHSFNAIFRPWAIGFQDLYEDCSTHADRVKSLASSAAKAELRDTHIEVMESRRISDEMRSEVVSLRSTVQELETILKQKVVAHGDMLTTLYQSMQTDIAHQRDTISQIHLNQLLSMPFWQRMPTSGESLEYCSSMRRRRHKWSRTVLPEQDRLQSWAEEPKFSLLATHSVSPIVQKDFMVDMIDLIKHSRLPVVWALRYPDYWETPGTVTDILRMLVLQALQINASSLLKTKFPLTLSQMREASTQQDWLKILMQALHGLERIFIVLDTDLLSHIVQNDRELTAELVQSLRHESSMPVKVLASTSNFEGEFVNRLHATGDCVKLEMMDTRGARRPPARKLRKRGGTVRIAS